MWLESRNRNMKSFEQDTAAKASSTYGKEDLHSSKDVS